MFAVVFLDNISYIINIDSSQKKELRSAKFGSIEDIIRYISIFYKSDNNYSRRKYGVKHIDNYVVFSEIKDDDNNKDSYSHIGHFNSAARSIYNEVTYINMNKKDLIDE